MSSVTDDTAELERLKLDDRQLFILLRQDLKDHKKDFAEHIEEYQAHKKQEDERWDNLINVTRENSQAVKDLTDTTRGMVEVYQAGSGAIKVGSAMGRFVLWCTQIAVIGVAGKWVYEKFIH